jgi:PTS system cellobiose-specific IIC component
MDNKFMNGLLTVAGKMQSNRVLSAIKDAFIDNMPIVIVGAFCTLLQWTITTTGGVPDPNGGTIYYISLANIPGLSWLSTLTPILTTANYGCMNFMAVAVCVLVAIHYAENLGLEKDNTVPAVAIASFITLVTTTQAGKVADGALGVAGPVVNGVMPAGADTTVANVVTSNYTSANGLFVGLLVGILATLLYVKLIQSGKMKITLPDSVPPNVARSFEVLFPAAVTIMVVSIVGFVVSLSGYDVFAVISTIMSPLKAIMGSLPGYLVIVLLMMLLWWFGIHGPNVMQAVYQAFFTQGMAENLELYQQGVGVEGAGVFFKEGLGYQIIANPFNSGFFSSTGSGITGGLIIAILLFSKRDDFKAIAKLAIAPGIFNINEPIIFGVPMVMNPLLGIPFFLAPLATTILGWIVTRIGICPLMIIDVPWTTPVGIFGLLSSSNIWGAIWQFVIIIGASTLIYTPFVMAANKQAPEPAEA